MWADILWDTDFYIFRGILVQIKVRREFFLVSIGCTQRNLFLLCHVEISAWNFTQ